MKAYSLIVFTLLIAGCNKPRLESSHSPTTTPSVIPLKEPVVATAASQFTSTLSGKNQRTALLNGLMENIQESTFYINDYIDFETNANLNDVQFHIITQCIESKNQNKFVKNITIPFKRKIYLIEMLPEEIFSYGKLWWVNNNTNSPSCSFHFKAVDRTGSIHYFELPHLPVSSFQHSWNLNLMDKVNPVQFKNSENFPVLLMEKISNYQLVSSAPEIDELKLICNKVPTVSFKVANQQQYNLWGLLEWSQLQIKNTSSACRFLSLYKNNVVGVSQIFPLVPPVKERQFVIQQRSYPSERIVNRIPDPYHDSSKTYYGLRSDLSNRSPRFMGLYDDSLEFVITNKEDDPLYLMIPNTVMEVKSKVFMRGIKHTALPSRNAKFGDAHYMPLGELNYFIDQKKPSFFAISQMIRNGNSRSSTRKVTDELTVGTSGTSGTSVTSVTYGVDIEGPYALLTVAPNSKITLGFGLAAYIEDDLCTKGAEDKEFVGLVFSGEHLPIYRVLNNNDYEIASKTIIQKYNWGGEQYNWGSDQFSWELWNDKLPANKIESYSQTFYKNTCNAARDNYFSESTKTDRESWNLHFSKFADGTLQFNYKEISEISFDESIDDLIMERTRREREKLQAERKRRKSAQKRQRQNVFINPRL